LTPGRQEERPAIERATDVLGDTVLSMPEYEPDC
jgi:hypothetical protein